MITELVKFNLLETVTEDQLLTVSDSLINNFWKKQDGFIDATLTRGTQENDWCFIYHFESMEKVKAGGEMMRVSKEFSEFIALVVPGSINVVFNQQVKKWG